MDKVKVDVYVLCYNEEMLVPFMLDYWAKFATNVYVLDNNSTDNSVQMLSQENRFNVEIISYESNNELNDSIYLELKNNAWKRSIGKCDFVVVCDFDEALFSVSITEELQYMLANEQTICFPTIFDMYSEKFPVYEENKLLHEIITTGVKYVSFGKRIIFNPNKISEINYTPGAHSCNPVGYVKYYDGEKIFLFHYKHLSIEYVLERYKMYRERLSSINKKLGHGIQYSFEDQKTITLFNETIKTCIKINNEIK